MSAKRTSVDAVFGTEKLPQAGKQNHLGNSSEPLEPIEAKAEIQEQERGGESKRPSVKQHTAYLPIPVHEHLRKLAFEENRKIHDYLIESLNRLFADRGLPSVEDVS